MIADILLIIIGALAGLFSFMLLPFTLLFNWIGLTPLLNNALAWLFFPLRYIAYWFDLAFLGIMIQALMGFFVVWYGYQIVRMMISLKSGEVEQPTL